MILTVAVITKNGVIVVMIHDIEPVKMDLLVKTRIITAEMSQMEMMHIMTIS
jgi:hypothetical protein